MCMATRQVGQEERASNHERKICVVSNGVLPPQGGKTDHVQEVCVDSRFDNGVLPPQEGKSNQINVDKQNDMHRLCLAA